MCVLIQRYGRYIFGAKMFKLFEYMEGQAL